jgi:uncharacterized cupredoxin-like copper-binding protein
MTTTAKRIVLIAPLALASAATAAALAAPGAKTTPVTVVAGKPGEFAFTVSKKRLPLGTAVFKVTNRGTIGHSFKVCSSAKGGKANACKGKATKVLAPRRSATLRVVFKKKGVYEYLCTVPGHAAARMKGLLRVG